MRKLIAGATAALTIVLTVLFVSPSAFAFVPPEPAGPAGPAPVVEATGVAFGSWSTVTVAVIAVIVGAVLALAVERLMHRQSSSRVVAV
jgi:uncharacterized membrane protein YdjX (TVP38/TMEM64 family)